MRVVMARTVRVWRRCIVVDADEGASVGDQGGGM